MLSDKLHDEITVRVGLDLASVKTYRRHAGRGAAVWALALVGSKR